jgi:hypothetical protein
MCAIPLQAVKKKPWKKNVEEEAPEEVHAKLHAKVHVLGRKKRPDMACAISGL